MFCMDELILTQRDCRDSFGCFPDGEEVVIGIELCSRLLGHVDIT